MMFSVFGALTLTANAMTIFIQVVTENGVKETGVPAMTIRKSFIAQLGENTGDNTPAIIHTRLVPGDELSITLMPKGAGSENMTRLGMLKPAEGEQGVCDFVVRAVEEAGGNCIILFGGANRCVTDEMIDRALAPMEAGDYLLMQNEINAPQRLIEKAYAKGVKVVLNPSPAAPEMKQWPLDKVDLFILNEVEGGDLTGESDPEAILDALLAKFPDSRVVLTLGEQGSVYADAKQRIRQAAFRADAVDTTAAGDTFTGYFLSALMEGKDIPYALKLASRASAITVSRPGAAKSIPTLDEVLAVLE